MRSASGPYLRTHVRLPPNATMAGLAKPCSNPRIVRSTLHFLFPPPSTCQSSWNARQHKPSYSRDAPAPVSEPLNRTPRYWQTYRRRGECIAPASRVFCAGLSQEYSFDACLQVQSGLHSIWIHISFPALPSIIMISHAYTTIINLSPRLTPHLSNLN